MSQPEELAQTYLQEEDKRIGNLNESVEKKAEIQGQVYECSCGKQYKSFPAIYLHFRTKHEIKLSTKDTQSRKKVFESQNSKKYVYSVEIVSNKNENKSQDGVNEGTKNLASIDCLKKDLQDQISACVKEFLLTNNQQDLEIYNILKKFFKGPAAEAEIYQTQTLALQTLPYYFNSFAMDFLPLHLPRVKIGSIKWKAACRSLHKFAEWLKKQQKTSLILIHDYD